ncbi:MAG: hypothetical protein ACI35Z_12790 [Sphingobacterium hotanense]
MKTSTRCAIPIALFFFCVMICKAQNATLTKEETINYINKKANEVGGHFRSVPADKNSGIIKYYYSQNDVSFANDKLRIVQQRRNYPDNGFGGDVYPCDFHSQTHEDFFNPAHIVSIEKHTNFKQDEPVGTLKIILKGNVGQSNFSTYTPTKRVTNTEHKYYGHCHDLQEYIPYRTKNTVNFIYLSYLQSDDSNYDKLKKALLYLRDLMKAEDDPFGN